MKRLHSMHLLSLVAALVVLTAGAAFAQSPQDLGNMNAEGATFTTGVVVSHTADSVTIRKDSGELRTLLIDDATIGADQLAADQRVKIDFVLNDQSQAIAQVIRAGAAPESAMADKPAVKVDQEPMTAAERAAATPAEPAATAVVTETTVVATAEPEPYSEPMTEPASEQETLPATASRLPALALLGLIALGAALVVRVVR